jgi:FkbM family methyltransferase
MATRLAKEVLRDRFRRFWGINGLDRRLAQLMPYRNGYYVELGANDGRSQSNTFHFERYKGWHGLLVEPSPTAFQHCVMTRSPRNSMVCACCVEPELAGDLIPMEHFNLMTTRTDRNPDQDLTTALPQLRENIGGEPDLAFRFGSEGRTLTELLDAAGAPGLIDFLSLDVEGNEINVLRGLDFARYQFRYLLIESRRLEVVSEHLCKSGYHLAERLSHHDYLFSSN